MTSHSSPTAQETPHVSQTTRISEAIRQRAEAVVNDRAIDAQSRGLIRYALEINDPWLAELVRRVDAGELITEMDFSEIFATSEDDSSGDKIEALVEMICRAGNEAATKPAALLVLMATLENSTDPKALANTAKHVAFTVLESELLAANTVSS